MEKEVLVLNCERCKEDFLYEFSGRGAKPKYCENCREIVTKEVKRRSKIKENEKKKALRAKRRALQQATIQSYEKAKEEIKVVNTPIKRVEPIVEDKYYDFIKRISNSLIALDTIRVDLCEISKQLNEYQSSYDKNDQTYLHKLEILDTTDVKKAQEFVAEWKNSRNNRRNMKDLILLTSNIIDCIPYKNYSNALPILKGNNYYKKD